MSDVDNGLRMLLRDSDAVKATLEVILIPSQSDTQPITPVNLTSSPFRTRRILAVVSHRDEQDKHEEGSVFVLKQKPPNHAYPETLEIQRVFPVCGDFCISMAQMRLGSQGISQDQTGLKITVTPSHKDEPLSFYSHDVQRLQTLLGECRRLKELSEQYIPSSPSQTYSWLTTYTAEHTLPILTSVPPDLRVLRQPLHQRLSPASAGSPGDDPNDILLIRDDWVRTRAREQTRKGRARLNIRIGTFNVNGQFPSQDLVSWVRGTSEYTGSHLIPPLKTISPLSVTDTEKDPLESATSSTLSTASETASIASTVTAVSLPPPGDLPDILVLGFQELDLSTEALLYSTSTYREDAWCTAVFAALGERHSEYTKLASKQLVGILIVVIIRKAIAHRFVDVRTCSAGVGIMGVMGNKGGVAVQLVYTGGTGDSATDSGGTVLTFVNSHLAAFDEMVEKRNSDFNDLTRRLAFGGEAALTIWESDAIFWMGDLNYRVDQPDSDVRELLVEANDNHWARKKNLDALMVYDQLNMNKKAGKTFNDFDEHPITHPPSYRYSPGVQTDSLGYDVKRKPAWTDRILRLVGPAVIVKQDTYTSHPEITMSDHRPVSANFTVDVDIYDQKARLTTSRSMYRQLQGLEQESRKVDVQPEEVTLGQIRYKQRLAKTVRLRNNGKTPCVFRFVAATPDGEIHPSWLSIKPICGVLLPFQPLDITLTTLIDNKTPYYSRELDCTLVLHTGPGLGKDRFIVVQGEYQTSCVGMPLVQLTRLPGPIRTTLKQNNSKQNLNSPREVMRLVSWLMENRLTDAFNELETVTKEKTVLEITSTMSKLSTSSALPLKGPQLSLDDGARAFSQRSSTSAPVLSSNNKEVPQTFDDMVAVVRECIDTDEKFPPGLPSQAYGAALLELLEGLIPGDVDIAGVYSHEEAFEVMSTFPIVCINIWISVTALLHYMVQVSDVNARMIASAVAPTVLRDSLATVVEKRRFVRLFIED